MPLSREFDYLPAADVPLPAPGSRVLVPFGSRQQVGLVLGHASESSLSPGKIRHCSRVLDQEPLLSDEDLRLIRFTSDYYHHPIGEVVAAALPALLRQGKALHPVVEMIAITDLGEDVDIEALAKRAPKQVELLEILRDAGGNGCEADHLTDVLPNWRRAARSLFERGLVTRLEERGADFDETLAPEAQSGPDLNEAQQAAVSALRSGAGFSTYLIEGITGSGKTEVLSLIHI